jgi:hypothetical protein
MDDHQVRKKGHAPQSSCGITVLLILGLFNNTVSTVWVTAIEWYNDL